MNKDFYTRPHKLTNQIQHYAWGQRNGQAYIPNLLGIEPETNKPYAELWIGAHPRAASKIGEIALPEIIANNPQEILGKPAKNFENRLPFLMKVLSAGEALSIQAHPNKEQAVQLHQKDSEHYPDDNHKPEIAIALDHLTALVGFRPIDDIVIQLTHYSPIADFAGDEAVTALKAGTKAGLKEFYRQIMQKAALQSFQLEKALQAMDKLIASTENRSKVEDLYITLRKKYSTDIGLFSLFLFNLVELEKGEAVFLKAGIPHAYLYGNIIECMANSDNVVRAGLTPKFKDIPTLVKILTYETGVPPIMRPEAGKDEVHYKVPIPEFAIIKREFSVNQSLEIQRDRMEIFIITTGKITITGEGFNETYKTGETVLIPASLGQTTITAQNETTLYSAVIPEN